MQVKGLNEKLIMGMKLFFKYLSYLMVLVYIGFSSVLLFTKMYATVLQPIQRYVLGGILFVYGIYRCFRVYKDQNTNLDENE